MKTIIIFLLLIQPAGIFSQDLYSTDRVLKMEIEFYDANYKELLKQNKEDKIEIPAKLIVEDELILDSVGVRYKGNSSYNILSDKKSFNISVDGYIEDQRVWGYKTLNLNNCFVDPTFMREVIASKVFSNYIPTIKAGYAYLYVNGEEYGLYTNVEQLNKDFLGEWYSSKAGNQYKGDPRGILGWKGDDPELYKEDYEKKTNEDEDDWTDLVELINVINNSGDLENELPEVLNTDRALWYFALCNVFVNLDSYIFSGHNYYLYNDPAAGKFDMLPWDMNEAFGVFPPNLPMRKELYPPVDDKAPKIPPLLDNMLSVPSFAKKYYAHYRTVMKEYFTEEAVIEIIDELKPLIQDYVKNDPMKLYTFDDFKTNIEADVFVEKRNVPGLMSFIRLRKEHLQKFPELTGPAPVIEKAECMTDEITPGGEALFNVKIAEGDVKYVQLYFRTGNGSFMPEQLFDDGNHGDGKADDNVFGGSVAIPRDGAGEFFQFYAITENESGIITFFPERAEFEYLSGKIDAITETGDIVINEFMASNAATIRDPQGAYPDWIELHNRGDSDISLRGWYLTDDQDEITKWQFPDVTIESNGYLLIWADNDTEDEGIHTSYKLDKQGEHIGLYDPQQNLIDSYTYGPQQTDVSEGRFPNGTGPFVPWEEPTPGKENIKASAVFAENENPDLRLYPNPARDFIEIEFNIEIQNREIRIFNPLGKCIKSIGNIPPTQRILIDISGLPAGVYYLQSGGMSEMFVKE